MSEGEDSDWYKHVNEEDLAAEEEDGEQPPGTYKICLFLSTSLSVSLSIYV